MDNAMNLLGRAVDEWTQFDNDEAVNGSDLIDWFAQWRAEAKNVLYAPFPVTHIAFSPYLIMLVALKVAERELAEAVDCYDPENIPQNIPHCASLAEALTTVREAIAAAEGSANG